MRDALLLLAALLSNLAGLVWLALALDAHWKQVHGSRRREAKTILALRALGVAALILSLLLCLRVDHASMASLVWIMSLAAAALMVALTLAWRPRWLSAFFPSSGFGTVADHEHRHG